MDLSHLVFIFLLTLVSFTEARTCARFYDLQAYCGRRPDCSGLPDVLVPHGSHTPDLMQFDNRLSMVLVEPDCWLTLYANEGFEGPCLHLAEHNCFDLSIYGEPTGCPSPHRVRGHGLNQPSTNPSFTLTHDAQSDMAAADNIAWPFGANETWSNVVSSYQCDCFE